jgi:endonuclease YncB( thermonuclease family)
MRTAVSILALVLLAVAPAAAETLDGPLPARVERVVDGDTIAVRIRIWLGQDVSTLVRIRGIDTPELNGKCAEEKRRAVLAATQTAEATSAGMVTLRRVSADKYNGRVLADVGLPDGRDLAGVLLGSGYARPYDGSAREGWCAEAGDGSPARSASFNGTADRSEE